MKAKLLSMEGGEGTGAVVEVDGQEYECMDCFRYGRGPYPKIGDTFDAEFSGLYGRDGSGRAVIYENPGGAKKLLSLGRWRYQAYGQVVAVKPWTLLDCGVAIVNLSEAITDPSAVGRFVSIEVQRLNGWRKRTG
ncbi:MAG TPA: hypothetical protein VKE95_01005 [Burkholderiales bacterium]|nr:hypothetical protein [Burkholderiales bacterium]